MFKFVAAKSGQISCVASSTGMLPGYLTGNVALKYEYRGLSRCYLPLREDSLFRVHDELFYLHVFCHHYQKPGPIIKKRISRFGGSVFIQSSLTVKWLTFRIYYCCVNTAHVWLWGRKWQKVCVSHCSPIPVVCCFKSPFCFLLSKLQSCCLSAQECQQFPPSV